jgi:hypothetical protein
MPKSRPPKPVTHSQLEEFAAQCRLDRRYRLLTAEVQWCLDRAELAERMLGRSHAQAIHWRRQARRAFIMLSSRSSAIRARLELDRQLRS